MSSKKAIITGITGQDGSYLAELLLSKNYEVHGVIRRTSSFNTGRIDHLYQDLNIYGVSLFLHHGDINDANTMRRLIYQIKPAEIYHLGAQSHVRVSFEIPEYTANVTGLSTLRILEAVKDYEDQMGKKVRFYQASSSEMFGESPPPQNELTPFHPRSPYGCAKVFAYYTTLNYREAYGIFAVNGILFNHESPRRGGTFVTRKITRGIARILAGLDKKIYLGNLEAKRDWGYAPEYMEAAWQMLQQEHPDDYVVGTGKAYSVREFLRKAFTRAGIDKWENYIDIDPRYLRPTDVEHLVADARKVKQLLGWEPKTDFETLVEIMVDADIQNVRTELSSSKGGMI
jgi:GDPmannose 4,6-dehydratase